VASEKAGPVSTTISTYLVRRGWRQELGGLLPPLLRIAEYRAPSLLSVSRSDCFHTSTGPAVEFAPNRCLFRAVCRKAQDATSQTSDALGLDVERLLVASDLDPVQATTYSLPRGSARAAVRREVCLGGPGRRPLGVSTPPTATTLLAGVAVPTSTKRNCHTYVIFPAFEIGIYRC
jgi:hypothetical protein